MPDDTRQVTGRNLIVFVLGLGYVGMYDILAVFTGQINSYDDEVWHRLGIVVVLALLFFRPTKFDEMADRAIDYLPFVGKKKPE